MQSKSPARNLLVFILILSASFSVFSQTRKRKTSPKKTTAPKMAEPEAVKVPTSAPAPLKKNERPDDSQEKSNRPSAADSKTNAVNPAIYSHFYEFSQPNFLIEKVIIEHDESGKGYLSFIKKGSDEPISEPIQVSPAALERVNKALASLYFINSNENYQYEKDFSHLGSIKFRLRKDGRERNTTFNWTRNKHAKALIDEYRKIGNQFIWVFDITVARENQPLEAPKLLDSLESLVRRNEISDAKQMIEFLKGLNDDERIPLIARNHAGKLVKQIEKETK